MAGNGGKLINGNLVVAVDHLTDFALMKEIKKTTPEEIAANPDMQWQNSQLEARLILKSGAKIGDLLAYLNKKKEFKKIYKREPISYDNYFIE